MLSTFSGRFGKYVDGELMIGQCFFNREQWESGRDAHPLTPEEKVQEFFDCKGKENESIFFRINTFKNLIDSDFYHEHLFVKPIYGCCLWAHVGPQGTIFGAASFGQRKGATSHVSSQFHALLSAPSLKPMFYHQHFKFWAKNEALIQTPRAETSFNQHKSISNFVAFASFPATFELLLHGPWMAPYMALRNALYVGGGSLATALLRAGTAVPNHLMWPSAVGLGEGIDWGPVTLSGPKKLRLQVWPFAWRLFVPKALWSRGWSFQLLDGENVCACVNHRNPESDRIWLVSNTCLFHLISILFGMMITLIYSWDGLKPATIDIWLIRYQMSLKKEDQTCWIADSQEKTSPRLDGHFTFPLRLLHLIVVTLPADVSAWQP